MAGGKRKPTGFSWLLADAVRGRGSASRLWPKRDGSKIGLAKRARSDAGQGVSFSFDVVDLNGGDGNAKPKNAVQFTISGTF